MGKAAISAMRSRQKPMMRTHGAPRSSTGRPLTRSGAVERQFRLHAMAQRQQATAASARERSMEARPHLG